MLWRERWEVATNDVYHFGSVTRVQGWFFWFLLEWLNEVVASFLMKLPDIPTKRVDEDGDPWEVWQDWYWCEVMNPVSNWIYRKYEHQSMTVDLDQIPREWHEWDFEIDWTDDDQMFGGLPEVHKKYQEFLRLREEWIEFRKKVMAAKRATLVAIVESHRRANAEMDSIGEV